jgi:hypothetical protein
MRPRELTANERGIIERILKAADIPDVTVLLAQAANLKVSGGIPTFIDLKGNAAAARATIPNGPIPVRALVYSRSGELQGEILLWVRDGYLSALEFAWFTDETPTKFPLPEQLQIERSQDRASG